MNNKGKVMSGSGVGMVQYNRGGKYAHGTLLFRFDPDSPTYHKDLQSIGKYLKVIAGTGGTGNGGNALEIKIEWERSSEQWYKCEE